MSDLLEDVKNFLDITWDMDIRERKKLSGIVERGKAYLEGKIGFCDFESISIHTPAKGVTAILPNFRLYIL